MLVFKDFDDEDVANFYPMGVNQSAARIVRKVESVNLEDEFEIRMRLNSKGPSEDDYCPPGYNHKPYAIHVLSQEGMSSQEIFEELYGPLRNAA